MQQQQATFKPRMRRLSEGRYLVESATHHGTGHQVDLLTMRCGCKSFQYRGGACKHITLAESFERGYQLMRAQATTARKEGTGVVPGRHVYGIVSRPTPAGSVRKIHYSIHDKTEDEFYGSYRTFEEARDALKEMPEEEGAVAVPMTAGAPSGIVRPVRGEGASMASTGARGMGALLEAFGG